MKQLLFLLIPAFCFAQLPKHTHEAYAGSEMTDGIAHIQKTDSGFIKYTITSFRCKICNTRFEKRTNVVVKTSMPEGYANLGKITALEKDFVNKSRTPMISLADFKKMKADQEKKHKHSPANLAKYNYSQLLVDSSRKYGHDKLRNNVITYVLRDDSCAICHLWYQSRINKDTFSVMRPAKYGNLLNEQKKKH